MTTTRLVLVLCLFCVAKSMEVSSVYSFGDSHSDTGNLDAAFPSFKASGNIPSQHCPYGRDFYMDDGHSCGRFCNGKLLIDFIVHDHLRFHLLSPYLRSVTLGSNFTRGANFAYGGATADTGNQVHSPFCYQVQASEFLKFQSLANSSKNKLMPTPHSFSDALFIVHIGGGDILYNLFVVNATLQMMTESVIPDIMGIMFNVTALLYGEGGARKFMFINQPALGCQPLYLTKSLTHNQTERDSFGCVEGYNRVAKEFNAQLNATVEELRSSLPGSTVIYADLYKANMDVMRSLGDYQFNASVALAACCGASQGAGKEFNCEASSLGGVSTMFSCGCAKHMACQDDTQYISWDGIHYTEQFNNVVYNKLIKEESSTYLTPPVRLVAA